MRHIDQNIQDRKLTSASLFQIQAMEPATSEHGNGAPQAKSLRAAGTKQHKSGTTRQPCEYITSSFKQQDQTAELIIHLRFQINSTQNKQTTRTRATYLHRNRQQQNTNQFR
ncbi:hypothetical protein PGT21_027875 [Puccinia graminis f. sp. tritici]|uniref:Uncharacterized protein n=1 Tax=Puccinia graminis f. sp. tritici TaxID=56615 RepID=A0A5B0PGQ2_PUCGR|nr:hypothetical protein PGT21_027875 [Puccinia graminis f. sp. tritici]